MKKIKEFMTSTLSGESQELALPDQPGHTYSMSTQEILTSDAEPSDAEGESLNFNKITLYVVSEGWQDGESYLDWGYGERILPNGDKLFYKFDGQSGVEEIIGGTGKFKNARGKGLYKGDTIHEGVWQASHEWEYEIVN